MKAKFIEILLIYLLLFNIFCLVFTISERYLNSVDKKEKLIRSKIHKGILPEIYELLENN
jgi:hypothetical protein